MVGAGAVDADALVGVAGDGGVVDVGDDVADIADFAFDDVDYTFGVVPAISSNQEKDICFWSFLVKS